MKSRGWVIGVSLSAGLLLGAAFWLQVGRLRREERRAVWLEYMRGPLELYVQGSRQGAELLGLKRLKPAQRMRLGEAVQALQESWTQAVGQQPDFEADAFFYDLAQAVLWHATASQLAESWPRLDRRNSAELSTARQAAEGIHKNLALRVQEQWDLLSDELPWLPSEKSESQAALKALLVPLPH